MARTKSTESFQAEDVFDRLYTVDIYIEPDGYTFLRLRDGSAVRRIAPGIYVIVETQFRLTSSDPNAP